MLSGPHEPRFLNRLSFHTARFYERFQRDDFFAAALVFSRAPWAERRAVIVQMALLGLDNNNLYVNCRRYFYTYVYTYLFGIIQYVLYAVPAQGRRPELIGGLQGNTIKEIVQAVVVEREHTAGTK